MLSAASLQWIHQEADRYQADIRPVTSVLQVTFTPHDDFKNNDPEQHKARYRMGLELERLLAAPMTVGGTTYHFRWYRNTQDPDVPAHFISRAGYADVIKATVMKHFIHHTFNVWAQQQRLGRVDFLMSRPLDYLAGLAHVYGPMGNAPADAAAERKIDE